MFRFDPKYYDFHITLVDDNEESEEGDFETKRRKVSGCTRMGINIQNIL